MYSKKCARKFFIVIQQLILLDSDFIKISKVFIMMCYFICKNFNSRNSLILSFLFILDNTLV